MRTKTQEKQFRLSRTIKNPHFDGRCKNQVKAIKQFEAGQIVLGRTWQFDNQINGKMYSHQENEYEIVVDGKRHWLNNSNHKDLCEILDAEFNASSEKVEPKTVTEAATFARTDVETFLIYAAEQLVKEGRISPVDLLQAYERTEE
jgi:hypothetical protein